MACSFYRLSLPCTTTFVFSSYVNTEDNNDRHVMNIKATTCNCIVVAHLKIAILTFLVRSRGTFHLQPTFLLTIFPRKCHKFVTFRPILMKFSLNG